MRRLSPTAKTFAAIFSVILSTPAFATATLTCDIKDAAVAFNLQGAVGSLSTLGGVQGRLDLKGGKDWPRFGFDLDSESVIQQWIDGADLRLRINGPQEHSMLIDLVILTRQKGDFGFPGAYKLKITDEGKSRTRNGKVNCVLG